MANSDNFVGFSPIQNTAAIHVMSVSSLALAQEGRVAR